jgi:hypothetical protein
MTWRRDERDSGCLAVRLGEGLAIVLSNSVRLNPMQTAEMSSGVPEIISLGPAAPRWAVTRL